MGRGAFGNSRGCYETFKNYLALNHRNLLDQWLKFNFWDYIFSRFKKTNFSFRENPHGKVREKIHTAKFSQESPGVAVVP